jgi:hypothetical protein
VTAEAVHVPVAVGSAAIRKQDGHLMQRFRGQRPEVPHHRRRLQIRFRIALLRVNEIAKLQWIANEKHRRVVAGHVPIALFRVELQRKAAGIALRVRRTLFAADG